MEYSKEAYDYENMLRIYLDNMLVPTKKIPLSSYVSSEDDLGPEVILNLKWLDAYRYPQKAVYLYMDVLQKLKEKHNWRRFLENPREKEEDVQDPLFNQFIFANVTAFRKDGIDLFPQFIR